MGRYGFSTTPLEGKHRTMLKKTTKKKKGGGGLLLYILFPSEGEGDTAVLN